MDTLSDGGLTRLRDAMTSFVGQRVVIEEYVSRSRDVGGTDRHFATFSRFTVPVHEFVGFFISGGGFGLASEGADNLYMMSLDCLAGFEFAGGTLTVIEHMEQKTMRQTRIRRAA